MNNEVKRLKQSIINGDKIDLIPYLKDHVRMYNNWLNDPYIQKMTQTEPISLDDEYKSQMEWKNDPNRYIFIIKEKITGYLAGDINIFIQYNENNVKCGELSVMIANKNCQRKGLAKETLKMIMKWAQTNLKINYFIAKIQKSNIPSINLFENIGFIEYDFVKEFDEYTFVMDKSVHYLFKRMNSF